MMTPQDLQDLVEFLHHGNTQVRQTATETLLPYSEKEPAIFKRHQLTPIKDLKLLVKDYTPIAKHALTILINISDDQEILKDLAEDDMFLESLLVRITSAKEPNANEIAMLLANLAKSDSIFRLLTLKRSLPPASLTTSPLAIDQLMDCFVKENYNKHADYDYLAYLFADLAKSPEGTTYFTTLQDYDSLHPISKLLPFTDPTHPSLPRRLGVASALKNISFTLPTHMILFSPPLSILPFLLRPLVDGNDRYKDDETDELPEELQLLDPSVRRDKDNRVLLTHLETLLLLTTTREGRDVLRGGGVYAVVRETHLAVEEEEVREAGDRLVQVLMRDEEGEEKTDIRVLAGGGAAGEGRMVMGRKEEEQEESDDDDKVVDVF